MINNDLIYITYFAIELIRKKIFKINNNLIIYIYTYFNLIY